MIFFSKLLSNASVLLSNWSAATVVRDATGNITDLINATGIPCTGSAAAACELGYNFSSCAVQTCKYGLMNDNQVHSLSNSYPHMRGALFSSLMLSSPHLWFR